jgi:cell division transport system permease protein
MASRRLRWSFGALFSTALVLLFVGIFSFLALSFHTVFDALLVNIPMKLVLPDYISDTEAFSVKTELAKAPYVKAASYVSKAQALQRMKDLGEDFLQAMDGQNPLPPIVELQIKPAYLDGPTIDQISKTLLDKPEIHEVYFPVREIALVLENATRIKMLAAIIGLLMLLNAILIIGNTIRLSIYDQRLTIRSMQLIGATAGYIRRPFLIKGCLQGFLGGLIACLMMIALVVALSQIADLNLNPFLWSIPTQLLYLLLIIGGAAVGTFGSWLAVNRYLNKSLDQLHQ